ncbi:helix-turn-helix domain-containing protein [Bradyrhizobium liaoningense]|uniref:helix-turn-helix domain-containing protein n=1 Tax=Bradyrhizobium liaoningense TaxID=43992 RepID=UPI001BA4F881|nr:XRE family transcriptional regulator [Bradyrhizobium liaoningense]MBR0705795.1 helix-turn-helix transcriptional regulator [Bradyrhizobium liaoningense]
MSEITTPEIANSQLGQCLKAARQTRGLTLKQVAERTGMALSTLSKVENGLMSLTYDKLLQLTSGLKMEIAELFNPAVAAPAQGRPVTARRSISRAGQGQVITTKFYTYTYQCTDLIGKRMVPIVAEVRARSLEEFGPLLRHSGEEYFVVTRGRVAVHTEFYAPEILGEGDGIYLDSTMGHAYLNAGEAASATGVCLCTSEAPDLYDQLRQIAARDVAPLGDDELPS